MRMIWGRRELGGRFQLNARKNFPSHGMWLPRAIDRVPVMGAGKGSWGARTQEHCGRDWGPRRGSNLIKAKILSNYKMEVFPLLKGLQALSARRGAEGSFQSRKFPGKQEQESEQEGHLGNKVLMFV